MMGVLLLPRMSVMLTLALTTALFAIAKISTAAIDQPKTQIAFQEYEISEAASASLRRVRAVNPRFEQIAGWISAVGAAVAAGDIDGNARPDDVCLVDPRTDAVTVFPAPTTGERFHRFSLPIPSDGYDAATVAPMGCLIGDFNEDGASDIVVYFWGRPPVLFLRKGSGSLAAASFESVDLLAAHEAWYTNAALIADVDGDGHADLVFGNYFPEDANVLDAKASDGGKMQKSMSRAFNGGRARLFLFDPLSLQKSGFTDYSSVLSKEMANGWTLALAAADLDGDLLPEIYVANDFGPDRLLVNTSKPGNPSFRLAEGERTLFTPRSRTLGRDSFKGMGADFFDANGDGQLDLAVSNISQPYALLESHFLWINKGHAEELKQGRTHFVDESGPLGTARNGWGWDIKAADFDNESKPQIVQALGFLAGKTDRWPELQELAMANDDLMPNTAIWPKFRDEADLSGHLHNAFFVAGSDGRYSDVSTTVGLGRTGVTRGLALTDVDLDGRLDLLVARQWDQSSLYRNVTPSPGRSLTLDLRLANENGTTRPAFGAFVRLVDPLHRTQVGYVDGGNGHSGKDSPLIHFGLGGQASLSNVEVSWRDARGIFRRRYDLVPGYYRLVLK